MIKSKVMKISFNLVFLILLLSSAVLISKTMLLAENSEEEDFYNKPLTINHLSNKSIEVRWSSFPNANKSTHYQVMLDHAYYGHSTKGLKETCKGLIPGSTIDVRLVTFHDGEFRGISTITQVLMAPETPTNIKIYDVATTSFSILWSGVESATSYNIYNEENIIATKEESGTNNRLTLSGFEEGSLLKIAMTAVNSTGESPKSSVHEVQLLPVASLSITIPNSSITSTSFKVKWTKQEYATSYRIMINDEVYATASENATEYEVTGLNAGTTVSVKVAVVNSAGEAESPDSIIVQLKPDAPVLTATNISSYSCTLTWSVANGANNYKIYENGDNAIFNVPSTITNVTITEGINPGTTVKYKVRGVNDIGESPDSNIVEVKYLPATSGTEETPQTSPSAPILSNRLLSPSYKIPDARFSGKLRNKNIVAVYFPSDLYGAELALEEEYLELLAKTPSMEKVLFYAIFTNEYLDKSKDELPQNMKIIKAKRNNKNLIVPGNIPVVRFYAENCELRDEILISIPILTVADVYKALPEVIENRSKSIILYHE